MPSTGVLKPYDDNAKSSAVLCSTNVCFPSLSGSRGGGTNSG